MAKFKVGDAVWWRGDDAGYWIITKAYNESGIYDAVLFHSQRYYRGEEVFLGEIFYEYYFKVSDWTDDE